MAYFIDFTHYSLAFFFLLQISILFRWQTPSESIYEEVFPQTSINQELQRKKETTSRYPADTSKQT